MSEPIIERPTEAEIERYIEKLRQNEDGFGYGFGYMFEESKRIEININKSGEAGNVKVEWMLITSSQWMDNAADTHAIVKASWIPFFKTKRNGPA